eukprot:scaffold6002_cov110-Isochrysis_galbana.AAC.3
MRCGTQRRPPEDVPPHGSVHTVAEGAGVSTWHGGVGRPGAHSAARVAGPGGERIHGGGAARREIQAEADLLGELASGCQHECQRPTRIPIQLPLGRGVPQQRQKEADGLAGACAGASPGSPGCGRVDRALERGLRPQRSRQTTRTCLGDGDHIPATQRQRQRLGLDGRGGVVLLRVEVVLDRRRQRLLFVANDASHRSKGTDLRDKQGQGWAVILSGHSRGHPAA